MARQRHNGLIGILVGAFLLGGDACHVAARVQPEALDFEIQDDDVSTGPSPRDAWMQLRHSAPPGVRWQAQDAATRAALFPGRRIAEQTAPAPGAVHVGATVAGTWVERGSSNQAGRIVASAYDAGSDRLYALAHGGSLWRRSRAANDWVVLNDLRAFHPNFFVANLALAARTDGSVRLLISSYSPDGVFYSDDEGASWSTAAGLDGSLLADLEHLVVGGPDRSVVYLTRREIDPTTRQPASRLYVSTDRGAHFIDRGFFGSGRPVGLFAPSSGSTEVYLLVDARLFRLDPAATSPIAVGTVPIDFDLAQVSRVFLCGGVTPQGTTFLYALFRYAAPNDTRVFRSLDGGRSWQRRGTLPSGLFTVQSIGASTRDPDVLIGGGVNAFRSADGGASWQLINDWTAYHQSSPATNLHSDIMQSTAYVDLHGDEHFSIATDGGLFDSSDGGVSVANLSLSGLRNAQYYGSYTVRDAAHAVVAGAQDQGFQKAIDGAASGQFVQAINGDYAELVSPDGGGSVWSSYPGFVLLDPSPSTATSSLTSWSYPGHAINDTLFLCPLAVAGDDHATVWLGGTRTDGYHIHELRRTEAGIVGTALPYDFGAYVTAMATSAHDPARRYAVNVLGRFFRSDDGGAHWQATASDVVGPAAYVSKILVDPTRAGRVYAAGAGYGTRSPVQVSDDEGASFRDLGSSMPHTLVNDLALSADGTRLFAATDVGAFLFDFHSDKWVDITYGGAPDQSYWDVDYIDGIATARFATFGRGLWDFQLADPALLPIDQHGLSGHWYSPTTAGQGFSIEVYPDLRGPGQGLLTGGWFSYAVGPAGAADHQRWWSLEAAVSNEHAATPITIYRNVGGNFDAPPATSAVAVGSGSLKFTSCDQGVLDYVFTDGSPRSGSIALTRLAANVECSESGAATTADADFAYSGNWYDPSTAGQGFIFEVNPVSPVLFATWYSYAPASTATADAERQRWFTLQTGDVVAGRRRFTNVPIYLTTGGSFDRAPTADQTTVQVGTADVQFTSCSSASVSYRFQPGTNAGRSGTIALIRVGAVPASCH